MFIVIVKQWACASVADKTKTVSLSLSRSFAISVPACTRLVYWKSVTTSDTQSYYKLCNRSSSCVKEGHLEC